MTVSESFVLSFAVLLLSGCATDGSHEKCLRTERVKEYSRYCCTLSETHNCSSYCTLPYYVDRCVEWACEEGYVKEDVRKEDLKWWQITGKLAGGRKCVPVSR